MPRHRRRSWFRRSLAAAAAGGVGALLFFGAGGHGSLGLGANSWSLQQHSLLPPPPEMLFSPPPEMLLLPPPELLLSPSPAHQHREPELPFPRRLLPVRGQSMPQHEEVDAVLLPDREVLVLAAEPASAKATCVFQGGASSPARALGRLPGPGRHAFLCLMPDSAHGMQTLEAPMLVSSSSATAAAPLASAPAAGYRKMLNWNDTMVFDSAVLDGGDALVFAKGPSRRQGVIRTPAANVQCIYRGDTDGSEASVPAITSGQQVIRMVQCLECADASTSSVHTYGKCCTCYSATDHWGAIS